MVIEASGLTGRTFQAEPGLPRYRNVHLALRSTSKDRPSLETPGHPWRATDPVPGDAPSGRWEAEITLRRDAGGLDFGGPFVRGDRTDRHLGLVWGDVSADGTFRLIRGSKLKLAQVDPALVEEALSSGSELIARIRYSDRPAARSARPTCPGRSLRAEPRAARAPGRRRRRRPRRRCCPGRRPVGQVDELPHGLLRVAGAPQRILDDAAAETTADRPSEHSR